MNPTAKSSDFHFGFTIVELIVVVAIIGLLMAVLLPAVQMVRESARRTSCKNNLRQIGLAAANYESAHRHLPYSSLNALPESGDYRSGTSWMISLLPHIEQHLLVDQYHPRVTLFDQINQDVYQTTVELFQCPTALGSGRLENISTRYSGNEVEGLFAVTGDYRGCSGFLEYSDVLRFAGNDKLGPMSLKIVPGNSVTALVVPDGRSNTILAWESPGRNWLAKSFGKLVERSWDEIFGYSQIWCLAGTENDGPFMIARTVGTKGYFFAWAGFSTARASAWDRNGLSPGSYWDDPSTFNAVVNVTNKFGQPFSFHPGICNVVMLDGSVATVSETVDPLTFFIQTTLSDGDLRPD